MRVTFLLAIVATFVQNLACFQEHTNSRLNFFDIDVLRHAAEGKSGNVVISPVSLKSILAMILPGARGTTASEIQSALRLFPDRDNLYQQLHKYIAALKVNSTKVALQNANAMFMSKKLQMNKEYEHNLDHNHLSEVFKVNFSDPNTTAKVINNWVNNKTRSLIDALVAPSHLNPSSKLLVLNTLYFKSDWLHAFNPRDTHTECFYVNSQCKHVAMMELETELKYALVDELRAHAVELPYEDPRYSMLVLVPLERDGISSLIRDLPYVSLSYIYEIMEPADVQLAMPKFTIDYSEDMVEVLQKMNIKTLFSSSSNLTGIFNDTSSYINNFYHRVHMSVDEAGSVAAAASYAMVVPLMYHGVHLVVNKPFVFFILDKVNELVLFEGKIEEPTASVESTVLKDQSSTTPLPITTPLPTPLPTMTQPPKANIGNNQVLQKKTDNIQKLLFRD